KAATRLLQCRLVSTAGWTGGHPAVLGNFALGCLQAFAPGLVGFRLGHSLGLLVAHRHLALGFFSSRGLRLEAVVDVVLPRLAFEFLVARLFLAGRHLGLLRIGFGRHLVVGCISS